jgi:transposase InsO family protein
MGRPRTYPDELIQRGVRLATEVIGRELHAANYYAYGYRRMWKALGRAGEDCGRDRVKRLMRAEAIQGVKRRGNPWRTTTPDPTAARPADLVNRDFTADRPDALWVADFTYLRCWEGLVFFSFVIDVFSRRVVGWQFASHMRTDLVLDALRMALTRRDPGADVELIHHTDAGSQPIHQLRLPPGPRRPPGTRVDRLGRRRLRQRAGRELRRHLQDRAKSATGSGPAAPSSSWRSCSGSPGSTTTASTSPSATGHQPKSRPSTQPGTFRVPLSINEKREPPNPVSAEPSPAHPPRCAPPPATNVTGGRAVSGTTLAPARPDTVRPASRKVWFSRP